MSALNDIVFRSDMEVVYLRHLGDDLTPLQAARVSTVGAEEASTEEDNTGLRKYLLREGHHVPFEHQVMTVRIAAPIFVMRQLLKHRISSISEESGRYREIPGMYYVPDRSARPVVQVGRTGRYTFQPAAETDPMLLNLVESSIRASSRTANATYRNLLEEGVAKEVARMVLPVNTYSSMVLTMNSRSLMNFFKLRLSDWGSHPQYEIEAMAGQLFAAWDKAYPLTVAAWLEVNPVKTDG